MDVYAENILEHFRNPRHQGTGNGATVSHQEKNISCGDDVTVHLTVEDNIVTGIEWEGVGCAISQAAMSMLSEELIERPTEEVLSIKKEDIYELLGVPIGARRVKCALIGLHTVKNAIHKYHDKESQSWLETVEIDALTP